MIVLASIHRNNTMRLRRYFAQASALRHVLRQNGEQLRVVAVEGDSTDRTHEALHSRAARLHMDIDVVTCNHNRPFFGSCEHPVRMMALSQVLNAAMDQIRGTDDEVVYIESDLIWHPAAIWRLIQARREGEFDILAPLVMAGEFFYDIWGYRDLDGSRFGSLPPFHPRLNGSPMPVSSVGSCVAMAGEAARRARVRDNMAFVGWCADARHQGFTIGVDPNITVNHPA